MLCSYHWRFKLALGQTASGGCSLLTVGLDPVLCLLIDLAGICQKRQPWCDDDPDSPGSLANPARPYARRCAPGTISLPFRREHAPLAP